MAKRIMVDSFGRQIESGSGNKTMYEVHGIYQNIDTYMCMSFTCNIIGENEKDATEKFDDVFDHRAIISTMYPLN